MNKIKDSFSKIKASSEFKDKLERELINNPAKFTPNKKNIYHISSISAASIALLLFIGIGYKLMINSSGNFPSNNTTYSQKTEDYGDKNYVMNDITGTSANQAVENGENKDTKVNNHNNDSNKTKSTLKDDTMLNSKEEEVKPKVNNLPEENKVHNDIPSNSSSEVVNAAPKAVPFKNSIETEDSNIISNARSLLVNSIYIPKVELPNTSINIKSKMIPLIVYKGKVYTNSSIKIASKDAMKFLDKKLGTTTNNINEWNLQNNYSTNLASNIGVIDVYNVNGYDESFRIMTNVTLEDGTNYPELYECLNGITLETGKNYFEQFKLQGNVACAKLQSFSDWNNGTEAFYTIDDFKLLNSFIEGLYDSIPYLQQDIETKLGDYRNDDNCKIISLDLNDGCKNITFTLLKSGYVYYGYPGVYFKIDDTLAKNLWDKLSVINTH